MTTVNATLSRETEDAAQEGVSGLVYSSARLTIDHEYLRDLLFKASIGLQQSRFLPGRPPDVAPPPALGVTWVMNRSARLSFTYDQTDLHGSHSRDRGVGDRLQPRPWPDHLAAGL